MESSYGWVIGKCISSTFLDLGHLSSVLFSFLYFHTAFIHFLENPLWKLTSHELLILFHWWGNLKCLEFKLFFEVFKKLLIGKANITVSAFIPACCLPPHIMVLGSFLFVCLFVCFYFFCILSYAFPLNFLLTFPGSPSNISASLWICSALPRIASCRFHSNYSYNMSQKTHKSQWAISQQLKCLESQIGEHIDLQGESAMLTHNTRPVNWGPFL